MKKFSAEPLKNWFGYTRRERRSSFFLLLIILALTAIRFIIPEREMKVEMVHLGQFENQQATPPEKSKSMAHFSGKDSPVSSLQKKILDLNTCDSASLEALPGIGPVLAVRIIKFRNLLGGYASKDQLKEVYGLSEETYNLISERVTADSSAVRRIDVNNADYKQLKRVPYFETYEVTSVLKYRELKGRINSLKEMVDNKLITSEKARKAGPYLEFGK